MKGNEKNGRQKKIKAFRKNKIKIRKIKRLRNKTEMKKKYIKKIKTKIKLIIK